MPDRGSRGLAPVLFAAACVLVAAIALAQGVLSRPPGGSGADLAVLWEARMGPVKAALPAGLTTIGYIDEADIIAGAPHADPGEFVLTQYSIAPILLVNGAGQEWIIGSFGNAARPDELERLITQALGPHESIHMNFGIFLIHRQAD